MAFYDQLGSFFTGETEEERRRREEEEAAKNAVPFKQTIVTDPVTGKQTMKMEGAVEDFTAANPNTPTVTGPVAPEMGPPRDAMMPEQYVGTPGFNPAASPITFSDIRGQEVDMRPRVGSESIMPAVAPVAPTTTAPTMEGVMAGPPAEAMMPPAAPAAATGAPAKSQAQLELERRQQQQPPSGTTAPTAEGLAMGPSMADAQPEAYTSKIEAAKNNPQALAALNADSQAPSWVRSLAAEELGNTILRQRQEQQAEQKLNTIVQNQGKGMERAIKDPSEEGSVFRAYLYARFGLNDLAKQEQQKLGAGDSYMQIDLPGGGKASVKFSEDGFARSGIDHATGKPLGRDVLEKLYGRGGGAVGKDLDIVGGTFVNDSMKDSQGRAVVGSVIRNKRTGETYVQTDMGKMPVAGFRPQSSGGSLEDMGRQLRQKLNMELVGKSFEEAMAISRPYNQLLQGQGLPIIQPSELRVMVGQIAEPGGATTQAQPRTATSSATPAAAQTTPVAAPAVPATRTPAAQTTPVAAPAVPTAPPAGGGRPTATEIEATGTAQKKVAEVTAEDRAKIINNYGQIKDNVDMIENLGRELINDKGFSVSVGASAQPGFQLIPGTDKATFYKRFDEIKGKQFLAAIESLKGTGAISDAEGKAATAAVSRLSLDMNEKEFRKAQHEFTSMMKRYADRASIKVGKEPIYNEPTMSQQVKENSEARRWLQKNAKDPRAEEVRQKLRERGEL